MRIEVKRNPEQVRREARNLLKSTDWYVIRQVEEKTPVPGPIRSLRAQARATLRSED